VGNPEGKVPLGRPNLKLDNTSMKLTEIGWEDVKWIDLAQDKDR